MGQLKPCYCFLMRWDALADPVFQHPIATTTLPGAPILAITQDHDGFLWVGTEDGVSRWDGYNFRTYRSNTGDPASLPDNYIQSLYVDAKGTLWIATLSGGLSRYDRMQDRFINYHAGRDGLSSVDVVGITDDGAGCVWIATNHGLDEINPERGVIRHLLHKNSDPASLPDNHVHAVLHDKKGRLYIATDRGLVRQDMPGAVLLPAPAGIQPGANCLYEDGSGRIWVGTQSVHTPSSLKRIEEIRRCGQSLVRELRRSYRWPRAAAVSSGWELMETASLLSTYLPEP